MTHDDILWRDATITANEAKYECRLELITDIKRLQVQADLDKRSQDFIDGLEAALDAIRRRLSNS